MTRWLERARSFMGVREIPGAATNRSIAGWLRRLGAWWQDDETPWCGVFVGYVLAESGFEIPKYYMRAKAWADWGANLRPDRLSPGAVLVFGRDGGGHVGFYVGEDALAYHVLGGNQSNAVTIMRIAKSRLLASRWPRGEAVIEGPVRLAVNGRPISRNEA
jgi:uncharacterized protein (TIGR02594 family)